MQVKSSEEAWSACLSAYLIVLIRQRRSFWIITELEKYKRQKGIYLSLSSWIDGAEMHILCLILRKDGWVIKMSYYPSNCVKPKWHQKQSLPPSTVFFRH